MGSNKLKLDRKLLNPKQQFKVKRLAWFVLLLLGVFVFLSWAVQAADECTEHGYIICKPGQLCSSIWFHGKPPCCTGQCLDGEVKFCDDGEEEVTPSTKSVIIKFCTDPLSVCTVRLFDSEDSYDEEDAFDSQTEHSPTENHSFIFTGLVPDTYYIYDITCRQDGYADLYTAADFTTLSEEQNLEISSDSVEPGIYKATFSWKTNKPANSKVFINGTEKAYDGNLVTQHSLTVTGLDANTTYNYYVMSATQTGTDCPAGTSGEADCVATGGSDSFTTLDADTSPDANVILRVDRDRVCDKWLYCNAGVEVLNTAKNPPTKEDICFSVGLCGEMDEGGNCANILDNELEEELTYQHPQEVSQIKNLSGYSKVGLDWGKRCINNGLSCSTNSDCGSGERAQCVEAKITGYYPYSVMEEVGVSVGIPNYNFEDGTERPWQTMHGGIYSNVLDIDNINRVLRVGTVGKDSGVRASLADKIERTVYIISFMAKTDNPDGLKLKVQLRPGESNKYYRFSYYDRDSQLVSYVINLKNYWQEYIISLDTSSIDQDLLDESLNILFSQDEDGKTTNFYLDNIQMKSVLKVANPLNYVARSCRMYPDKNALACDYYDEQKNKEMRGWKGYCVEPDPGYSDQRYAGHPVCLQWWPVDVLAGESNIFSNEPTVGYMGRKPLFYCVQSEGNYPYYNRVVSKSWGTGSIAHCSKDHQVDVSALNIYKNDIIEIKIDGVQIDHNNYDFNKGDDGECGVEKPNIEGVIETYNPAIENKTDEGAGAIIFNDINRPYWEEGYQTEIDTGGGNQVSYNKYAALRCYGNFGGHAYDISTARLEFDEHNKLINIFYKHCDGSSDSGGGRYKSIRITFKGERCNQIVEVVTPEGENKVWATRVKENGWKGGEQHNFLNYSYEQDYYPYGASVVSGLDYDPAKWEEPLYVMPPNKSFSQPPYQIRAGSPYSIKNKSTDDSQTTIGRTQCIAGAENMLGKECKTSMDCGSQAGLCMGIELSDDQQKIINNPYIPNPFGDAEDVLGKNSLKYLFAKSYGGWEWKWSDELGRMAYVPSSTLVWDISQSVGVEPRVEHILVNNRDDVDYEIVGEGAAVLKFTSWVNPDQVPLVSYTVDWRDGQTMTESGLRIAPKSNIENPHILVHYYKFDENCSDAVRDGEGNILYCRYQPKVTIKDNWELEGGAEFQQYIRVYPPGTNLQSGQLEVDPTQLTHYSTNGIPQTQSFIVSNANEVGEELEWEIVEESGADRYFKDSGGNPVNSIEYKFEYPHYFGYQGTLYAGQQERVYFTITNIGSADEGVYYKTIKIRTTDGTQEKTVTIKLVVGSP